MIFVPLLSVQPALSDRSRANVLASVFGRS
jgi:hypothetical protein